MHDSNLGRRNHEEIEDTDSQSGILVIDGTASRAWVPNNIFEKAIGTQDTLRQEKKKDCVVVVSVGAGTFFRRPGASNFRCVGNQVKISEVIDQLDAEFGLVMPIFVFGWVRIRRCVSIRSARRVPTHLVLMMGKGQSNENVIQALGRGTFNGKNILKDNGHDHVTVLTQKEDLAMCTKYYKYQDEVQVRLSSGETTEEAMTGSKTKFEDDANFWRHTERKTGRVKEFKKDCRDIAEGGGFLEPTNFDDERDLKEKYWGDTLTQRVLKQFTYLLEDGISRSSEADIIEKFNDTYQDIDPDNELTLTKKELRPCLKSLVEDKVVEKVGNKWKAKSLAILDFLTNDEIDE